MQEVRRLRQAKGWNQTELAFHADLAPSVVSQIENGKRNPSARTLEKLATALDVEVGDLFPKAQAPLPLEEDQDQRGEPFVEAWTAYLLRRAQEWEEALPEGIKRAKETDGRFEDLYSATPGLAFEVLRQNERVQAEAAMMFEIVFKAIRDAFQYVAPLKPSAKDIANWCEEGVSPRQASIRIASGGRADLKELIEASVRADDATELWYLMAHHARRAAERETARREELKRIWNKSKSAVEERREVMALMSA
jgi:transcriptional regulator with XRE-family HTH domain